MDGVRAWWLILVVASGAVAEEGEGAPGKGKDPAAGLKSTDAAVRAKAIRALGRDGDDRAPAAARAALDDADGRVRAAAAATLVRLVGPDERALKILVASLRDPDWYTRWDACTVIGSLGEQAESAATALLAAAAEKDLDIAREAVNAALRVAPTDAGLAKGLVRVLESDAKLDRRVILRALDGNIAPAKDWLAREVVSDRHGLRADAVRCLREDVPGLDYRGICLQPAEAVAWLWRDKEISTAVFIDLLKEPDLDVRRAAAGALSRRGDADAGPAIAKLLEDKEPEVRLSAARALVYLDTPVPEAGPALVRLAAERDKTIAAAARAAMYTTGLDALGTLTDSCSPGLRLSPQVAWNRVERLEELVKALEDERHGAALVAALRETLADDRDEVLLRTLAADDAEVRRAAAALLGHLARDRKAAIAALEVATHDGSEDVGAAATKAIERLREE